MFALVKNLWCWTIDVEVAGSNNEWYETIPITIIMVIGVALVDVYVSYRKLNSELLESADASLLLFARISDAWLSKL